LETNNRSLFVLFIAVFIDLFGFGIIIPILPFFADSFGANGFQYGLIISVYSLMQFIFSPLWGNLSDKVGRRPVILIGLGGSAIGFSIFGIAKNLFMIYLARSIAGIFTSATIPTSYAYISDTTSEKDRGRGFGLIIAAFGLGFALGPAVGGLLADHTILGISGYILPSFLAASLSILNLFSAYFLLPESLNNEDRNLRLKSKVDLSILSLLDRNKYPGVLLLIIIFAFTSLAFSNYITAFALYAPEKDITVREKQLGWYYTYTGTILFLSQTILINPLLKRFSEEFLVKVGLFLCFLGFILLPVAPSFYWMFLTNTPIMLGIALINPLITSLISKKSPRTEQGSIMGKKHSSAAFMRIIGPLLGGMLFDINIIYPFYFASIIFISIFPIAFYFLKVPTKND